MIYLILYNVKPDISDWAKDRFDFDLKKYNFELAPMFVQDDGDLVMDAKWLIEKVDTNKYDGVIAYVKGDILKGVWGTHTKMQLGDKKFSVMQVEHHDNKFRRYEKKGLYWTMKGTRIKTKYPQGQYTFNHELVHSYKYLKGQRDLLHWAIKFKNYDGYIATIPKKITVGLQTRVERDIKRFVKFAKHLKVPCRVTSDFRSFAEQDVLYNKRPKVTNAKGGESFHNYGVAFDVVPTEGYNISARRWLVLGVLGELMGYTWGGRWKSLVDKPHFQLDLGYTIKDFQEDKIDWSRYS